MAILGMHSTMAQSTTASGGSTPPAPSPSPPGSQSPSGSQPGPSPLPASSTSSSSTTSSSFSPPSLSSPTSSSSSSSSATSSSSSSQPIPSAPRCSKLLDSSPGTSSSSPGQPTSGNPTQPPSGTSTMSSTTTIRDAPLASTFADNISVGFPLGCWLEGSAPGKALEAAFFEQDTSMTPAVCSQLCSNYTLFGLEYGTQCMCGNTITPGHAFPITNTRCQIPCSGNSSLACGGQSTIYIYQQLPPPPSPPSGLFSNISYTPGGCLAEAPNGARALDAFVVVDPAMTPALCAGICGMSNYRYFGVEYGDECWCDNSIAPGAVLLSNSSQCNFPCPGDSKQTCGGLLSLNLWNGTDVDMAAYGESQEVLTPGLDRSQFGENMPVENRFYNPEPRLLSLVRPVPQPMRECDDKGR